MAMRTVYFLQRAALFLLCSTALQVAFCEASGTRNQPYVNLTTVPIARVQFRSESDIRKFLAFHRSNLSEIHQASYGDLLLTHPTTRGVTNVLLPAPLHNRTVAYLKNTGMKVQISSITLEQAMRRQSDKMKNALLYESVRKITGYFPRYSEIVKWMESLAAAFPEMVQLTDIGRSFESRRLVVIKLGSTSKHKRMIFVESGIHAREWLAPASCIWIIDKLMHEYAYSIGDTKHLLEEIYDFGFIILANPDGYEYTHTANRFWRRTRSVRTVTTCSVVESCTPSQLRNLTCVGVDANRNWDIHFNEIGTAEVCSDVYPGPKAFSEVETERLAEYVASESFSIRYYLALHSYGQMWFVPPGYTRAYLPEHDMMMKFAKVAVDAIKNAGGAEYALGTHAELLYMVSGSSADWVIENGVAFSATVELPPAWRKHEYDLGTRGFLAKASDIPPSGRDILVALRALANALYEYDNEFK